MSSSTAPMPTRAEGYRLFEQELTSGLRTLALPPTATSTRLKHTSLPTFAAPVETFELSADFPGAVCVMTFGQSVVDATLFFSEVELHRDGQPTLFLRDYWASRHDPRLGLLRFKVTETSLEQGIALIVNTLLDTLDQELKPLLEGKTWMTAPLDWGDHK